MRIEKIFKHKGTRKEKSVIKALSKKMSKDLIEKEFQFSHSENIIVVRVWLNYYRLIGLEITTNKGSIKKFGYTDDTQLIKIENFVEKKNTIISFVFNKDDKDGVNSMNCYYLSKRKYSGLFYLRVKLKKEKNRITYENVYWKY